MDHNGKPLKVTGILLAQRVAELPELIERLAARMMDNDQAKATVALVYQGRVRAHGLPLLSPIKTRPRLDYDLEQQARCCLWGGWSAQTGSILLFAGLGTATLNMDAPKVPASGGLAVLGLFFCMVTTAIVTRVTKASARNPGLAASTAIPGECETAQGRLCPGKCGLEANTGQREGKKEGKSWCSAPYSA